MNDKVVYINKQSNNLVGEGYPNSVAYIREDVVREALTKAFALAYEWGGADSSVVEVGAKIKTNEAMGSIMKGGVE